MFLLLLLYRTLPNVIVFASLIVGMTHILSNNSRLIQFECEKMQPHTPAQEHAGRSLELYWILSSMKRKQLILWNLLSGLLRHVFSFLWFEPSNLRLKCNGFVASVYLLTLSLMNFAEAAPVKSCSEVGESSKQTNPTIKEGILIILASSMVNCWKYQGQLLWIFHIVKG